MVYICVAIVTQWKLSVNLSMAKDKQSTHKTYEHLWIFSDEHSAFGRFKCSKIFRSEYRSRDANNHVFFFIPHFGFIEEEEETVQRVFLLSLCGNECIPCSNGNESNNIINDFIWKM